MHPRRRPTAAWLLLALAVLSYAPRTSYGLELYELKTFVGVAGHVNEKTLSVRIPPETLSDSAGGAPGFAKSTAEVPKPGALGVGVEAFGTEPGSGGFASAEAFLRVDDLVFSCLPSIHPEKCPPGTDSVDTHLHMLVDAGYNLGILGVPGASSSIFLQVEGRLIDPAGFAPTSYLAFDSIEIRRLGGGAVDRRQATPRTGWLPEPASGVICILLPDCLARTETFTARLGVPHVYEARITAEARASDAFPGPSIAGLDTFAFPTTGPVFDLPLGFTADSPSLSIVDNRWLSAPPPGAVPAPSTLLLAGGGLAWLTVAARRRRDER